MLSLAPKADISLVKADQLVLPDDVELASAEAVDVIKSGQEFGSKLETKIATGLREQLAKSRISPGIFVASKGSQDKEVSSFKLTDFWPYSAPPTAVDPPHAQEFYKQMGRGHLIQPDVVVWREINKSFYSVVEGQVRSGAYPMRQLIACISGKATIRSDRSQSSRYEGSTISRWRHARPPHFVVVTAEPDPARLGSLAWGLGEIDCVYHVSLPSLRAALGKVDQRFGKQSAKLHELDQLIEQARVRDLSMLFEDVFGEILN